jgi:hypothetical protein
MAGPRTDLQAKATARVNAATGKLTVPMLEAATDAALSQFSSARPREVVAKVAGAGTFDYPLTGLSAILAAWSVDFSQVLGLIFPYDSTVQTQEELQADRYGVVRLDTGDVLRFFEDTPAAAQFMLIRHSARHAVTDDVVGPPAVLGTSTIAAGDLEAVADLVAAYCCDALASYYCQSTDSTISADTVNRMSKAQEYRSQAKQFRTAYADKMRGDAPENLRPAGGFTHSDSRFSNTVGDQFFFHVRR